MDEGGNGTLSSSDSGDTSAAGKKLTGPLWSDASIAVGVAAETFSRLLRGVYQLGMIAKKEQSIGPIRVWEFVYAARSDPPRVKASMSEN